MNITLLDRVSVCRVVCYVVHANSESTFFRCVWIDVHSPVSVVVKEDRFFVKLLLNCFMGFDQLWGRVNRLSARVVGSSLTASGCTLEQSRLFSFQWLLQLTEVRNVLAKITRDADVFFELTERA